jgi:hypothetical protein
MRAFVLGAAALLMASGAEAGTGDELACMKQSYTAAQTGQLDGLLPQLKGLRPQVDLRGNVVEDPAMNTLAVVVGQTVAMCAVKLEWNDIEFASAVLFEFGRFLETGMRRHGPLTKADIVRIDAALGRGDRSALWAAIEEEVAVGLSGEEEGNMSDADAEVFKAFIIEAGFGPNDAKAEQVGAFLTYRAMQRVSQREFIAVQ